MSVAQIQCILSGRPEGDAVNNWYFVNAGIPGTSFLPEQVNAAEAALANFYTACANLIANDVTITFPSEAKVFDEISGQVEEVVSGDSLVDPVVGTGSGVDVAKASHVKIQARTGVFSDGREIRGGIFLGPAGSFAIENGVLQPSAQSTVIGAGQNLLTEAADAQALLVIWRRPRPATSPLGARDGSVALVQNIRAWEKIAVLTSRRD